MVHPHEREILLLDMDAAANTSPGIVYIFGALLLGLFLLSHLVISDPDAWDDEFEIEAPFEPATIGRADHP